MKMKSSMNADQKNARNTMCGCSSLMMLSRPAPTHERVKKRGMIATESQLRQTGANALPAPLRGRRSCPEQQVYQGPQ